MPLPLAGRPRDPTADLSGALSPVVSKSHAAVTGQGCHLLRNLRGMANAEALNQRSAVLLESHETGSLELLYIDRFIFARPCE